MMLLLTAFWVAATALTQEANESARSAALKFVLSADAASRLQLPSDTIIVVRETEHALYSRDYERTGPRLSSTQEAADAAKIARVIGSRAKIGAAADFLECVRYDCAASGRFSVVMIRQAARFDDGVRVAITVFHPGEGGDRSKRTMQGAIVMVSEFADGWTGSALKTITPVHPTRVR